MGAVGEHLSALGVAKFKFPERMEIRDQLPMTNVTTPNKAALRAEVVRLLEEEAGHAPAPETRTSTTA